MNTQTTLEISKGISEYGILIVMASVWVVYMIYTIWNNVQRQRRDNKRYDDYINSITKNTQDDHEKQKTGIETANKSISMLLHEHNNLFEKSQVIIKTFLKISAHLTIREINNIKHENGINDRDMTLNKCNDRAKGITESRMRNMAIFQYKGKCLDKACDGEFTQKVVQLMHKEIYRDGENSYIATRNAVEDLYDTQIEEMTQRIKDW